MKKALLILLCFAMLIVGVACNKNDDTVLRSPKKSTATTTVVATTAMTTTDKSNDNTDDISPQIERFLKFQEAVDSNKYDKWLNEAEAAGELPLGIMYSEYSRFWVREFNYSLTVAESLFDDPETYLLWKSSLEEWLETTTDVIRIESQLVWGQIQEAEILFNKCQLIREKVIDIKYFCYLYEETKDNENLDTYIGLKWANDLT